MTGKPTIVQLEYIVAVDNYRHFATAAEKCFVTQPTLSMQIQKLEEQLGVVIFDRSKHPVVPTASGKVILDQSRKVLHEVYAMNEVVNDELGEFKGDLRIGIIPTIAPYLLPEFLAAFLKKYPEVHIHLEELVTDQVIEKLKKELLDAGIVVTPLNDKGLNEIPLYYEEFLGYISQSSGLFKDPNLTLDLLKDEKIWILNEGHCFREQVINICDLRNEAVSNTAFSYESGSLESIKRLVDIYGGVTLLPELAQKNLSAEDQAKIRVFNGAVPTREISIITHRNYIKKKFIDVLKKEILAALPENIRSRASANRVEWR